MNNLRQYINLIDNQQTLNEIFNPVKAIRNLARPTTSAPKLGDKGVDSEGFSYTWLGAQWGRDAKQKGGGRMATKAVGAQLTANLLKSRGNVLTKLIKKNPKLASASALAILGLGGGAAYMATTDDDEENSDQTKPPEKPAEPEKQSEKPAEPKKPPVTVNPEMQKIADEAKLLLKHAAKYPDAIVKNEMEKLDMFLASVPGLNWKAASWF